MVAMLLSLVPSNARRSPAAAQPQPFGFIPNPNRPPIRSNGNLDPVQPGQASRCSKSHADALIRKRPSLETKPRHEYNTTGTVRDQDLLSTRSSGIDHRPPRGAHSEPSHA